MKRLPLPLRGLLLCGGKSSRMGRDKALLEVRGEVLWRRQLQVLEDVVGRGVAVAGRSDGPWVGEGWPVVEDLEKNSGPLGGVGGGLVWAGKGHLLVLAVDLPLMQPELLRRLVGLRNPGKGVVGVVDGSREPLAAVYPVEALALLREDLNAGRFALRGFWQRLAEAGCCIDFAVAEAERALFLNLNRPEDLESFSGSGLEA